MMRLTRGAALCLFAFSPALVAAPFTGAIPSSLTRFIPADQALSFHDLAITLPGWELKQTARDGETEILRFAKGTAHVHLFSGPSANFHPEEMLSQDSQIIESVFRVGKDLPWEMVVTLFSPRGTAVSGALFWTQISGRSYYGYATVPAVQRNAKEVAMEFLSGLKPFSPHSLLADSLTGPDYKGKKYYLGFGAAMQWDPSSMHNEVKYDVLHTHDIFTKEIGGNYQGTAFTSYKDATGTNIKRRWSELKALMTSEDMYVQYSSGHGSSSGLAIGVNYNQIRDAVLGFNAKETVIFIMACHSGGLVEAFDAKKSEWQNFPASGRTLFVMASSNKATTSSTGPGKDPEEPQGPTGSAGSAFGHALWKSLIGHADGIVDGIKDKYLSLEEIEKHTTALTTKIGEHTPVHTGAYDPKLIMNRIPPKAFLNSLERGTDGLTDEEIARQVQELDALLRLR